MRRVLPLLLATLLFATACGDDDDGSPTGRFAVTVEIVNPAGEPVPGLELALWNDSPYLQDAGRKASTRVGWIQPMTARARVTVEDIEGNPVQVLVDEEGPAGNHWIMWNGRDEEDVHQFSGRYTVRLEGFDPDTGEVGHTETVDIWMVMGSFREGQSLGTTNARGRIVLTDMRLFPHLYDRPPIQAADENGESVGLIELDADMVLLLRDPVGGATMRATAAIERNGDHLVLVWNPITKAEEAGGREAAPRAKLGEPPLGVWALRVFPNPFN